VVVEKNVRITERFFDNHYKMPKVPKVKEFCRFYIIVLTSSLLNTLIHKIET